MPYLNDAAILGAVHGDSVIYTTEPDSGNIPIVHLWDKRMKRPTVLGRELVQLDLAGSQIEDRKYEQLTGMKLGPSRRKDNGVTFKKLYDVLDQLESDDDRREMIKSLQDRANTS